ncbi:hypothetical protein [Dactylosporangium sp. CA-233914]|uniref:hypothetical protein n=1 Tax=Dactylosporangium sp. CA-233914 TaxID=3239934 RepID=UPI003D8CF35B
MEVTGDASADEPLMEVICPACGGIVEAIGAEELVAVATEHTRDVHGYDVPREHILNSARSID